MTRAFKRPPPLHEVVETARIEALHSYLMLDTEPPAAFTELAMSVASGLPAPFVVIALLDRVREWVLASAGFQAATVPRHLSFSHHALDDPGSCLLVRDAWGDGRFGRHAWVAGAPFARSYAGVAITDADGYQLGTVAVLHPEPGRFGPLELDWLRRMAAEVAGQLSLHRAGFGGETAPSGLETHDPAAPVWQDVPAEPTTSTAVRPPAMPGGSPVQGWLGVRTEPAGPPGSRAGLRVMSVAMGGPASRAGLMVGDVLLAIDRRPVREAAEIVHALAQRLPGEQVQLTLLCEGETVVRRLMVEPAPLARTQRRRTSDGRLKN